MADKIFKEYYNRLAKEGWLNAAICGMTFALMALFVSAMAFWVFAIKQLWLLFVIFGVIAVGVTLLSYFVKYRPSTKDIARRVDALGLEERLLTMTQLQNDESYIAMKQREDALNALKTITAKNVKIAVSTAMLVIMSITLVFSMGATTVYALSNSGVLPSGGEMLGITSEDVIPEYELIYEESEGGVIEGEIHQVVEEGKSGTAVEAIPDDGYAFFGWVWIQNGEECSSDDPYRIDEDVRETMVITAQFIEVTEGGEEEEEEGDPIKKEGDPQNSEKGDKPGPPASGDGAGEGSGDNSQENKQIKNGETYYGDSTLSDAESQAGEKMSGNENISDGEKGIVGDYYDTIRDN